MKKIAEIILLSAAVALLMGADNPDARFQRIGDKIMCSCGCSQMLLKCNHVGCPNSDRMLGELHALTGTLRGQQSGQYSDVLPERDDEAVLNWFRSHWGVTAVVEPGTKGLELWAWIMPWLAPTLGLVLVLTTLYLWRSRRPQTAAVSAVQLDPQLEALRDRARRETEV
jgi:cytochrome c-type biogenesis protein CcmH